MLGLWKCSSVFPFWRDVLDYIGQKLKCNLPKSPRSCLLGDRDALQQLNKYVMGVFIVGLVTCARLILRRWCL